jgi:hypothetical protein
VQGDILRSLSGTADDNICRRYREQPQLSSSGTRVLRFDGTSWSVLANLTMGSRARGLRGRFANNDASCGAWCSRPDDSAALYRVTNGVATLVMTVPDSAFEPEPMRDSGFFAEQHRRHDE